MIPPPWRRLRRSDLAGVLAVAAIVHPGYPESEAVLGERLDLYPAGCFGLDGAEGLCGYLLSHPWHAGRPPKLDTCLGGLPADADTYYVHDLALHPAAQGSGAATAILGHLFAVTATCPSLSLVAVNGSAAFWRRHGFAPAPGPDLASYGDDAVHMLRRRD
jgi:GNAT superfamily N-acetyltransferase